MYLLLNKSHKKLSLKNPSADTPIAKIKYWRSLPADNIQLGDDVYFECEVGTKLQNNKSASAIYAAL